MVEIISAGVYIASCGSPLIANFNKRINANQPSPPSCEQIT